MPVLRGGEPLLEPLPADETSVLVGNLPGRADIPAIALIREGLPALV